MVRYSDELIEEIKNRNDIIGHYRIGAVALTENNR